MNRYFKLLVFGYISAVIFCFVTAHAATPTWATPKDASQGAANGVQVMDAGDINGDGMADVVACSGGMHANSSIFAWFEAPSTINGTWTKHNFGNDSQLRAFLGSCILYDFDKDGDLDLCVSSDNHHGTNMQCDLYIYVNPGPSKVTGSWSYQRVTASTQPWNHVNDIAVDDMDKDGKPDIICRSLEPNQIHIFFQNSIGSWTKKTFNTNLAESEGLAVGDINKDGIPDIEYTGYWLKAPSSPRTSSYTVLKIDDTYKNTNQNTKEDLGDIDGDGDLDLVLAPAEHYRDGANHILAWYSNPGGTPSNTNWTKHTLVTNLNDIGQIKLRDMDDDGDLDIVYGHCFVSPYYTKIMYNNGSGSFTSTQTVSSSKGLYTCGIIDFDGDGDLDISGNETYAGGSKPWVHENLLYDGSSVTKYTLTVTSGSGDGSYAAGATVTISADAPSAGQMFDKWTGSTAIANVYNSTTTITMPAANTTVVATYKTAVQDPYGGTAWSLPGKVEAEDYDTGGEGVAYHDETATNKGGQYRTDDVDIYTTSDAGGYKVGSTAGSEWLEYTVDVTAGTYDLTFRVATPNSGQQLVVKLDGSTLGTLNIPVTGAWETFTDLTLEDVVLSGGTDKVLRLELEGSGWDLNYFTATAVQTVPTYTLTVTSGSGDGSYEEGKVVTIAADAPATGKVFDKWTGSTAIADVNSSTTTITMPAANTTVTATYADVVTYSLTVNNGSGDGSYEEGAEVTVTADAPASGKAFDAWTGDTDGLSSTTTATATYTMGTSAATITATYKDVPTGQYAYGGTPHAVPGRIEAEYYDEGGQNVAYYDNSDGNRGGEVRTDDVDIYPTPDGGTQYKIGYNAGDEWVEYTVNAEAGVYTIRLRAATPKTDGTCPISIDGSPVGTITIPNTGDWDAFTDVELRNVSLAAGEQVVRLEILGSGWDLNWFEFEKQTIVADTQAVSGTGSVAFGATGVSLDILSLTGSGDITVETYADSFPPDLPGNAPVKRFFHVSAGTGITGIRTVLTFSYTQDEFDASDITDESTLYCARYDGGSWIPFASVVDVENNTVSCTTTGFSIWSIGGEGAALPVQLSSFTGSASGSTVELAWATASEQGCLGFNVLRSAGADGPFVQVNGGLIAGAGTTGVPQSYSYSDEGVANGTWYYRLEQKDVNGAAFLSDVIPVSVQATGIAVMQPENGRFDGQVRILRMDGTPVAAGQRLTAGMYIIIHMNAGGETVSRMVKYIR